MKKIVRILLWLVGVTLALLILVSLLAGPVATGYVNKRGESITGRRMEVKHVGLNLLTGHVNIRNLQMYEDDRISVFAEFDTLDVCIALLQLPFRTVNLRHITLCGLQAQVMQDGERFNFTSLVEHFASDNEDKDTTSRAWTLKFYNIHLSHADLRYADIASGKSLRLPDINLRVPGFVLGGGEATEGGLNIGFDKGGHLGATAHYNAESDTYSADVDLVGFALSNVEDFVRDFIVVDKLEGTLTAHVSASGKTTALLGSKVGAVLSLTDVALTVDRERMAGFDRLDVKVNDMDLADNRYDIDEVHLIGMSANYVQWEDGNTINRLMKRQDRPKHSASEEVIEPMESAAAKNPVCLNVGHLQIDRCSLTYTNHTLPDEFVFPVTDINVNATGLTFNGESNAQLRASLPGGGHLAIRWQGFIDNWKRHQEIFLTIKGLALRQLSPWTVAYTGQPVEDGVFGLTSRNSIVNSELNGQNSIDIFNPLVGKKRKDVDAEHHLPLKTALYVLKDKDNKILLDVPVSGNVDSPEFNYMKLVWKTLGNLIVKVATSPARALGSIFGMGGDELEFITVDPAQQGLTSEQYHTLGQLASIMQSDSLMVLRLVQRMPVAADDTIRHLYEMRNELVRRYLIEQGLDDNRVSVTIGEPVTGKERTGYAVGSELKIDE